MSNNFTIVLEDHQLLQGICGANDLNTNAIQVSMGVQVFTRGNEIILDSSDPEKQSIFKKLIDMPPFDSITTKARKRIKSLQR